MSDENFLSRWSRLKRDTATEKKDKAGEAEAARSGASAAAQPEPAAAEETKAPESELDLSSLPSIEDITAGTDIRAFLQSGVPAELTKAALRRAWTADPSIRDFVGLAENQWDFTNPSSIPGFGPLSPTDNVAQLVARAIGAAEDATSPAPGATQGEAEAGIEKFDEPRSEPQASPQAAGIDDGTPPEPAVSGTVEREDNPVPVAPQQVDAPDDGEIVPKIRSRGRALPQ